MIRTLIAIACLSACSAFASDRPNVILLMADDLGWGDTAYNGHPFVQTPALDAMAANGLRFDRWYAASAVCSPTRASCLTGRNPIRLGIPGANKGHLPHEETTIAEALKPLGYTTGHFGKWHLGTLTKTEPDSNRGGPENTEHYSPPWEHGFDKCFSTEAKVPTYDPMLTPLGWARNTIIGKPFGTHYWTGPGEKVEDNLSGDDSRIIMDRAIPFIRGAAANEQPFLAVIWFHAPHLPVLAGERHRANYPSQDDEGKNYFGCITAMDEQIARLRNELRSLELENNTMLWFCSDNGPEGARDLPNNGSSGIFRGRKRSLHEGGVRVPALLEWPARITPGSVTQIPCVTSDYFPTILDIAGIAPDSERPLDGISLLPLFDETMTKRANPIGFIYNSQRAYTGDQYKLYSNDEGETFELFDLLNDPSESNNILTEHGRHADAMQNELLQWVDSLDN